MKWAVFALAIPATLALGVWLRRNQHVIPRVLGFMAFLPFAMTPFLKMNLVMRPEFPGYAHGLALTIIDLLVIALSMTHLPKTKRWGPVWLSRSLYFAALAASLAQADHLLEGVFPLWQLVRMYFLFSIVFRAAQDWRVPESILRGLQVGVIFTALLCLLQRYAFGYHEAQSIFGHQNPVGPATAFGSLPSFALLLAGRRDWLTAVTPIAGGVAVVLSLSRGSLLLYGVGLVVIFAASLARRFTWPKLLIALFATLFGGALFMKAYDQIANRFATRTYGAFDEKSLDERGRLEKAASLMIRDNPLGVGANQFSVVLHRRGYIAAEGIVERGEATQSLLVHNLYLLLAAELGYFGLAAYLLMMTSILIRISLGVWRNRGIAGDALLGIATAMTTFHLHGLLEFLHIGSSMQYLFWSSTAIGLALAGAGYRGTAPVTAPVGAMQQAPA